jgi:SAM-dependent methyltransferase
MIEKGRENVAEAGVTNVEFRLGDAESMPVDSESVDWIISNCVINLAPDKTKVFQEVERVLRPGGQVLISDIVLGDDLPDEVVRNLDALVGCVAGAIKETDYLQAMLEAGLSDVEVQARTPHTFETTESCSDTASGGGCGCGNDSAEFLEKYGDDLRSRIWSARISARKTGTETRS